LSGFPWAEAHGYLKLSRCDNLNSIDVEDTYNVENRLVERESSDGRHIEIVYDGDGNRVSKTVDGITVYYLVDANNLTGYAQVMEELVTNHVGALVVDRVYTYGLDLITQNNYLYCGEQFDPRVHHPIHPFKFPSPVTSEHGRKDSLSVD
jgi:YD repeat-containing protein